jgi:hypothetical protein
MRMTIMRNIVLNCLAIGLVAVVGSWVMMLLLGAAHSVDARVPAFGFVVTLVLDVVLAFPARLAIFAASLDDK